ncbi:permease [candidate division WOR-3 bacterium]|nr:permease [candidate division WOR-3 bacterium]
MDRKEIKLFLFLAAAFSLFYLLPVSNQRFQSAVLQAFILARWYAREHVLLCLVPAFFIAGAIAVFISQNAVLKYFGAKANKLLSYGVASVSGTILAVCSCTVLPLFGSIYMRGAGIGPATAFLYSGPAINVLAIILTARILGAPLGIARAVGAVSFSVIIGLMMHLLFIKEERIKNADAQNSRVFLPEEDEKTMPLWQIALQFASMVGILIFANFAEPKISSGPWFFVFRFKWHIVTFLFLFFLSVVKFMFKIKIFYILISLIPPLTVYILFPSYPSAAFTAGVFSIVVLTFLKNKELSPWRVQTWGFAKQILPLLLIGVLAAGFFLGTTKSKDSGMIPNAWIESLVGDSPSSIFALLGKDPSSVPYLLRFLWPLWTNFFASLAGALMYFATLTEVPILKGLIESGMGKGPSLALLLAGPALSLPNMLVINSIVGAKKTFTFISLVVILSTIAGLIFGAFF